MKIAAARGKAKTGATAILSALQTPMRRRTRTTLLVALSVVLLLAVLAWLRGKAPPEVARLLPESDGILYLNFEPLRTALRFDQHPVPHDAAYQSFLDQTGFVFERDLRQAAVALHRQTDPRGPNGTVAYSEVIAGRLDRRRITTWLEQHSTGRETYANHTIYAIASEGRTVRVTLLGYDMVAASNTPTPEQIHAIVDRSRTAALPFSGSSVLSKYYGQVPALSIGWGIGRISLPLWQAGGPQAFGVLLPVAADTDFIASVRYLGSLRVRVEEIAPSQAAAAATTTAAQNLLGLLSLAVRSVQNNAGSRDYAALLDSATVEQHKNRTVLTATVPLTLVHQLTSSQ